MAWDAKSAKALEVFAGAYALPGGCWAVLTLNHSPPKNISDAEAYPESYAYTWAILAPGEPPNLRGHRMAGIDNSDDNNVRAQIQADCQLGKHRAHRHFPDWARAIKIGGEDWPVAGPGLQLANPPATPMDFWKHCMECLSETLELLGLETPNEKQLLASRMTEAAFRDMQKKLRLSKQTGLPM